MLEECETTMSRDNEIKALGDRLRGQAGLLGVGEPDVEELEIRCGTCGVVSCHLIASMECPPTTKDT